MSKFRDWSLAAKVMTAGAAALLLTFGLCSFGTGFEGQGTPLQDSLATAGLIAFFLSVILFGIGILAFIGSMLTRPPRGEDKR